MFPKYSTDIQLSQLSSEHKAIDYNGFTLVCETNNVYHPSNYSIRKNEKVCQKWKREEEEQE